MTGIKKSAGKILSLVVTVAFICLMAAVIIPGVNGADPVDLGTAGDFVILAKSAITDIPPSVIVGNVGMSTLTGASITGLTCGEVTGTIYTIDDTGPPCRVVDPDKLTTAASDMVTAYNTAQNLPSPDYTDEGTIGGDIGGMTLLPGLHKFTTAVTISHDITLSGSSSDVWIFQIPGTSALGINDNQKVILSGGAQAQNIFWVVGGATTLGTNSVFNGTILDQTAITLGSGAILNGRALAQTAVTLNGNTVTIPTVAPAAPVASFTGTPATGTEPLTVVFTDSSTGSPASWLWDFGDSDITNSTVQNPVHTYASAGTCTVALTATNAGGSDTATEVDYISVLVPAPVASFTGTPATGTEPLTVVFTDRSTGSPASWLWDFGDSDITNSTVQNPVHTYASAGTYTVALTATNAGGSDTATEVDYISVLVPAPVASFTSTPTTGTVPLTVVFTDSSTGSPVSWLWDFGDGDITNSTVQNPVHTYASAGTYTVSLTVTDVNTASDTKSVTDAVTVTPALLEITVAPGPFLLTLEPDQIPTNADIEFVITSSTDWQVTAYDANPNTNGYMTDDTLNTHLSEPFMVRLNSIDYVALPTSSSFDTLKQTGTSADSGTPYTLGIQQAVRLTDPHLPGNDVYRIVVTLTVGSL